MGRARLKVADALVGFALKYGVHRCVPTETYGDLKVVDARFRDWCIELLLEGDHLGGLPSANWEVPELRVIMQRPPTLEGDALLQVIADHQRNSEGFCSCEKLGLANGYTCEACRSKDSLQRVPTVLVEQATAMRRAAGELVASDALPDTSADPNGEVPGS